MERPPERWHHETRRGGTCGALAAPRCTERAHARRCVRKRSRDARRALCAAAAARDHERRGRCAGTLPASVNPGGRVVHDSRLGDIRARPTPCDQPVCARAVVEATAAASYLTKHLEMLAKLATIAARRHTGGQRNSVVERKEFGVVLEEERR